MKKFLKITFWVMSIVIFISMTIYANIQLGYAQEEKERAIAAEKRAGECSRTAEEQSAMAARAMEEAASQVELLKAELESCKGKK